MDVEFIRSEFYKKFKTIDEYYLEKYLEICLRCDISDRLEHHHILPRAIWKKYTNLKCHPWNGVKLTFKNHVLAHYYFSKATNRLYKAIHALVYMGGEDRMEHIKSLPESDVVDLIEKLKESNQNFISSEEWRQKLSVSSRRRYANMTEEQKAARSKNISDGHARRTKEQKKDAARRANETKSKRMVLVPVEIRKQKYKMIWMTRSEEEKERLKTMSKEFWDNISDERRKEICDAAKERVKKYWETAPQSKRDKQRDDARRIQRAKHQHWQYFDELYKIWQDNGRLKCVKFRNLVVSMGYPYAQYQRMVTLFNQKYIEESNNG